MYRRFAIVGSENDTLDKMNETQRIIFLFDAWHRQCETSLRRATEANAKNISDCSQEDLMKIVFSGIKVICCMGKIKREHERLDTGYREPLDLEANKVWYPLIELIFNMIGQLELRNFITIFPITKDFDGEKWGCKDYFYTKSILDRMDWDKPIGTSEDVFKLLWDYQNDDLQYAYMEYMSAMSNMYRSQTGEGIMDEWCEDVEIDTYTVDQAVGIVKNNQTGEVSKISKCPSYLRVIK